MDKLIKRACVTVILVAIVAVIIYRLPAWLFCVVVALFIGVAQLEFFRMVQNRNIFVYKYFGTVVGVLIPVVIYMGSVLPDMRNLEVFLIMAASLFAVILQFLRTDNAKDHLVSVSVTLFALFYISWFFSFFVKLRMLDNGANLVAFLIIVTKGTDIGAYVGGSLAGRHELIPRISPKKTKEGTMYGLLTGLLLAAALGKTMIGFSLLHASIVGAALAVMGQVGDLAESLIKRDCSVKDSGPCLSEIGGVFDLIDSLLFTAPIFYFYVKML